MEEGTDNKKKIVMLASVLVIALAGVSTMFTGHRSPLDAMASEIEVAKKKGDFEGALKKARARVELAEKSLKPDAPQLSDAVHDVGSVLVAKGNYVEAKDWIEKSIRMDLATRGMKGAALGLKILTLADVYESLGDHQKSSSYAEKALDVFNDLPEDKKIPERIRAHATHAKAELSQKNCVGAQTIAEQGLELAKQKAPKEFALIGNLDGIAGKAAFCRGDAEGADSYIKEALQFAKKNSKSKDSQLPELLALSGDIQCRLDKCKQGTRFKNDAYKAAIKVYGESDPRTLALQP